MNPIVAAALAILISVASAFAQRASIPARQGQTMIIRAQPPAHATTQPAVDRTRGLAFDAESKEYNAKIGEAIAPFVFSLTNISTNEIIINNVTTSCGCTVAQLPSQPWHLAPGANGEIKVTVNLAGKMGHVSKQVNINSSVGFRSLVVHVNIPVAPPRAAENLRGDRNKNMELAKADRQAVFKGDCRSCHVDKGAGKMGKELYAADCAICHESPIRAAMVPDLRAPKGPRDHDFWMNWITYGRAGSMMPAFGEKDGGPLSKAQIDSLVAYMSENFPQGVTPRPTAAKAPQPPLPPKAGGSQ